MSTSEAAELLGVKTSTVYTYVSRGHLASIRKPGDVSSWFRRSEVERLARSPRKRRSHSESNAEANPQITAITEIQRRSYRYRGRDPFELATTYRFEQVAEFLWTGSIPDTPDWPLVGADPIAGREALPLDVLRLAISDRAIDDPLRFGKPASALVVTGRGLMTDLVASLPKIGPTPSADSFAAHLWCRLTDQPPPKATVRALGSALTIVADHGIAPSTAAVRMAAGYRADLYGAIQSGMSIMAGGWYGRRALSAERMLDEIERVGDAEQVVGDLFRQGGVPCLGQPRYEGNDPRTAVILDLVSHATPDAPALLAVREVQEITRKRALPAPSVELALAAMCRSFGFVTGASEAVFALGRTAGWIAHAIEMYSRPVLVSPAFTYESAAVQDQGD